MPTVLVVTADLGGNLPPLLGVAARLLARGWRVVLHGDEALRPHAEALGVPLEIAEGRRYDPAADRSTLATLREIPAFWTDRTRGRSAVAAARRTAADVAVVDPLLLGSLAALQAADVPTVALLHSTWEGTRAWFSGPVGVLLRLHGIDPTATLARADRVVVASDELLGRPFPLPGNAVVTGPVLEDEPVAGRPEDGRAGGGEPPLVLLGLSTVAFPGQRATLQRLLDAAAGLPVRARVRAATGRSVDAAGLRVGANTLLERRVDHGRLMPAASAIVTHGGHATTVRALAHDLPVLFVPMHPLMDQPRIARAVAAEGAGLVVPRSASPERMRAALARVLEEPRFAAAAARLGARIRDAHGADAAADAVEEAAARRATGRPTPGR